MRYRGGGVGHIGTRQCNKILLRDEHPALGEIFDSVTELAGSQGAESDSDSEGKDEDEDDEDGGEDDNELTLTQAGEWNDFDIVAAAGLGAF